MTTRARAAGNPWGCRYAPAMVERHTLGLLFAIGENPAREGLTDTPKRVARAWRELTAGYRQSPRRILSATFSARCDEMIVVDPIEFWSTCEHHLMPFHGTAHIGYVPGSRVVGLSKIARLVHCFGRRLQIQERMTREIAEAFEKHVRPAGVAVVLRASHMCMSARGVRTPGRMTTSCLFGVMRDPEPRAEFLSLIRR